MDIDYVFLMIITYGGRLLFALLVLVIGLKVIRLIVHAISKKFERAEISIPYPQRDVHLIGNIEEDK